MSTITALALILLILMLLVGGKQGWVAYLSLFLNFCSFYLGLVLVALHVSPFFVTLAMGLVILATTIFMGTDDLNVSVSAFQSSILVMLIVATLVLLTEHFIQATGFSTENSGELEGMSILIGISYVQIGMMTMILSCLGAVAEAAIAISSGLVEVIKGRNRITSKELFQSGMKIGRRIIGTTMNTLLLGFMGSYLALFIWFAGLNYSFGTIMNNKLFVTELVTVLISFIGVIITVPLTTVIVSWRHQKGIDKHLKNQYDTEDN